ncbi:MAG TPA: hypothetical protein PKL48_03955 [Thermodesulfobacteriota bacterium]|nr:hypothetical protein [Thermodesulfobacteriota bacterium]
MTTLGNEVAIVVKVQDDGSLRVVSGELENFVRKGTSGAGALTSAWQAFQTSWMGIVAAVYSFKEVIDIYNAHDKAVRDMGTIFGSTADAMIGEAKNISAATRNLFSVDEVMDSMARFASGMKRYGIEGAEYINMISRATDIAASRGLDLEATMTRLEAAMRGEAESSEYLGLTLNDTYMKTMAFDGQLKNLWEKLTDTEKVTFRYAEMMKQTAEYQGEAALRGESFENQCKRLWNTIKDLLIPVLQNFLIPVLQAVIDMFLGFAQVLKVVVGESIGYLMNKIADLLGWLEKLPKVGKNFEGMAAQVRQAAASMENLSKSGVEGLKAITATQEKQVMPAMQSQINIEEEIAKVTKNVAERNVDAKKKEVKERERMATDLRDAVKQMEEEIQLSTVERVEEQVKKLEIEYQRDLDNMKAKIDGAGGKKEAVELYNQWVAARTIELNDDVANLYEQDREAHQREIDKKQEQAERDCEKQQELIQKQQEDFAKAYADMVEGLGSFMDELVGQGEDLEDWWGSLWDRLKGLAMKAIAEMVATMILQMQGLQSILGPVMSLFGIPMPGVTGAVPSMAGMVTSGSGSGLTSIPGLSSLGSFMLPDALGGWEIGLGELGIAAMAGNYIPQLFGGQGGLPSSIGATVGYVGGTALLSSSIGAAVTSAVSGVVGATIGSYAMPVIGTVIGAALGEAIGGLFGDDDEQKRDERGMLWSQAFADMMNCVTGPGGSLTMTQQAGWLKNGEYLPLEELSEEMAKTQYAGWKHTALADQMSEEDYKATLAQWDNMTVAVANDLDEQGKATAETAAALYEYQSVIETTAAKMEEWGPDAQAAGQALIDFYYALQELIISDVMTKFESGLVDITEVTKTLENLGMNPLEQATTIYDCALNQLLDTVEVGSDKMLFWYQVMQDSREAIEENQFWAAELEATVTMLATAEDLQGYEVEALIIYYRDLKAALEGDTEAMDRVRYESEQIAAMFADEIPTALETYIEALKAAETQTNLYANALSSGFQAGFGAATSEEGWAAFEQAIYQSIYDTIVQSVIDAFIQSEVYKSALAPFTEAIGTAMETAWAGGTFDSAAFQAIMGPALEQTITNVGSMESAFGSVYDMLGQIKDQLGLNVEPAIEETVTGLEEVESIEFTDKELKINIVPTVEGQTMTVDDLVNYVVEEILARSRNGEIVVYESGVAA